jgi:hypothetical protein
LQLVASAIGMPCRRNRSSSGRFDSFRNSVDAGSSIATVPLSAIAGTLSSLAYSG